MSYILIVEDDIEIAENIALFLSASHFETLHLETGEHVVSTVKENTPELILLDVMLPIVDGINCCKDIREFSDVPIVMMTAKVEEIDRIIGLEAGADDYVCKPFSAVELILRIKAILRRVQSASSASSEFTFNKSTFELRYKNNITELTQVEFALFELLSNRPNTIFSRPQILDLAYPDMRDISDRTIDSHVKNIRKKIKQLGIESIVLDSVYGVGYRYLKPE